MREFVLTATDSIDLYDVEHLVDLGLELEASTSSGRAGAVGMLQAINPYYSLCYREQSP